MRLSKVLVGVTMGRGRWGVMLVAHNGWRWQVIVAFLFFDARLAVESHLFRRGTIEGGHRRFGATAHGFFGSRA